MGIAVVFLSTATGGGHWDERRPVGVRTLTTCDADDDASCLFACLPARLLDAD